MKKINLTKGLKKSNLLKVRIEVNSKYDFLRAWSPKDADEFNREVYLQLDFLKGLKVKQSTSLNTSPTLVSTDKFNKTEIYLHPMEFTGYATKTDIKKIEKVLSEANCVKGFKTETEKVYDLDDDEYRALLSENIDKIVKLIKEEIPDVNSKYAFVNFAFDFAKVNRVPRVGDHDAGYCSDDCDINFINSCLIPIVKKCSLV